MSTKIDFEQERRFWLKVDSKTTPGGCWPWRGATLDGYGRTSFNGVPVGAHRLSMALTLRRNLEPKELVCHRCDFRACCRPAHLFLGTHQENMRDMVEKGRSARGEGSGVSKLTEFEVCHMRNLRTLFGWSYSRLAAHFGVSNSAVRSACVGDSWALP